MSPSAEHIKYYARYFGRHAAQWRVVKSDAASAAQALASAPPRDAETWRWPDLALVKEEFDEAHAFLTSAYLGQAGGVLEGLAVKLEEAQKLYALQEAEGERLVADQVLKELNDER